jgi:hypothetical protein
VYNAEKRLYLYDNIPSITLLGETDFSNVQPSFGFHLDNMGFTKAVKVADDQLLLILVLNTLRIGCRLRRTPGW